MSVWFLIVIEWILLIAGIVAAEVALNRRLRS
jgi:hypothetical protein